jgi:hypothetical protein
MLREGFQETSLRSAEPQPRPAYSAPAEPSPQPEKTPRPAPPPVLEEPPRPEEKPFGTSWPIVVKLLHKKIANNNGELVDALIFREPRGGDINRYGNPCRINQDGDVVIDERKMSYVMAALCGILPPMLENMDTRDWNSCAYRLRDFFLPDLRAWQ